MVVQVKRRLGRKGRKRLQGKGVRNVTVPALPVAHPAEDNHRIKHFIQSWYFPALVARPVGKRELESSVEAMAAMKVEWDRLYNGGVFDLTTVREWDEVAAEYRDRDETCHMGRLFGICVEKGSELPLGSERRKYKYRVVFQGNRVTNQSWEVAIFQELGSSPATMKAGKAVDCHG